MARNFYVLFLIIAMAGLAYVLASRAPTPPAEPTANMAEFGGVSLRLDYATDEVTRERGLSGRTDIPSDYGMLFVFPKAERYGFWMKSMLVPIDMFWLDDKGQVVYIAHNVATSTYPDVLYPPTKARYVLETAAGFGYEHSIVNGTSLVLKNFPEVTE